MGDPECTPCIPLLKLTPPLPQGVLSFLRQIWLVIRWELRSALAGQTIGEAAATQTWAAVAPVESLRAISGAYLNGNAGRELGSPDTPSELAQDDALAAKVVEVAKKCVASS